MCLIISFYYIWIGICRSLNSNEDGGRLRKFYWEFMKKVYDWKSVYLRGSIGDTLLAYVPPGINKRTNLIKVNQIRLSLLYMNWNNIFFHRIWSASVKKSLSSIWVRTMYLL